MASFIEGYKLHCIFLPRGASEIVARSLKKHWIHTFIHWLQFFVNLSHKKAKNLKTKNPFCLIWLNFDWKHAWSCAYGWRSVANKSQQQQTSKYGTLPFQSGHRSHKLTGRFQQSINCHIEDVNREPSIHVRVLQRSRTENCLSAATVEEH